MSLPLSFFFLLCFGLMFNGFGFSIDNNISTENQVETSCPLNFDVLKKLMTEPDQPIEFKFVAVETQCQYVLEGIRLVRSEYLRTHGYFLPLQISSKACWLTYRSLIIKFANDFDIQSSCGYHPEWISRSCKNISSLSDFEKLIPESELLEVRQHCNRSLGISSRCALCNESLLSLGAHLQGPENGYVSDCEGYPYIYAAAMVNQFGPTDLATAQCLFSLEFPSLGSSIKKHNMAISGAIIGGLMGILGAIVVVLFLFLRKKILKAKIHPAETGSSSILELTSFGESNNLVKYNYEEIRRATKNFSWENIIGNGKYGNVYKGIMEDGSEVAFKRFKNCSATGDGTFAHEIEVIASIRHVNLVSVRGYCSATVALGGHQRIIVCDLMHNGSLHDHLFGSDVERLSWPIRHKIALGTARGLAYLHCEAQSSIIHRDIKASNILLNEKFEAKVADFGLAKFNKMGRTHFSTRLAGTLGYVAPEYALYGQLTDGSDVYSFGVVLLEILSGKKAFFVSEDREETSLLTDWAWVLARQGRAIDVIEENMPEVGLPEVMEQFVLIALHCCHPHLHARPTMDQIVKLLESKQPV